MTRSSNKEMLTGKIEDFYGTGEFVIFPNQYDKFKGQFKEEDIVKLTGHIGLRDGNPPNIIVDKIEPLRAPEQPTQTVKTEDTVVQKMPKLYLRLLWNDDIRNKINTILNEHKGIYEVVIKNTGDNNVYKMPQKVDHSIALISELTAVLGQGNVVFK